jgi:hypothetical protein
MSQYLPPLPRKPITRVSEIYVDESSHTKHRYLVLGGLIATPDRARNLEAAFARARLPELPAGELKWTKVSATKLPAYERVIREFFAASKSPDGPHFHALVVDTTRINDRRFNQGSRELGFNKEVYQLLIKMRRLYQDTLFHVYPDYRSTSTSVEELREILNRGSRAIGKEWDWPYRRVHWRESRDTPCIQVVDLLIGALAFNLNGHHLAADASHAKCSLSDLVVQLSPTLDVTRDTAVRGSFTIWHRQLR